MADLQVSTVPFLRWAGSKRWLLAALTDLLPKGFGHYYEPFVGSGAVFFSIAEGQPATLSDTVEPLISCYRQVQLNPDAVYDRIQDWETDRESYYTIRSTTFADPVDSAAQFIYLNKLCFNGLYRVNQQGKFNVPYGRPKSGIVATRENLNAASRALHQARLQTGDFEQALENCAEGDLVYLDPPYVAGHRSNGFVDYNARIFRWEDQRRLASVVRKLNDRGVFVLLSNADHPSVRELYDGFVMQSAVRYSSMSARSSMRGPSAELLVLSDALVEGMMRG
ncbi:Modification methylase DpnIIA [Agromyces sp. NDB4Y10]|uniref:DNA adenine methylase n=1 Tax=Agromyces sp. NDB4Y10 TaxID=1775951 RepID=UPI0007B2B3FB|nr:Dam family site-specific DNA-(adenine-N6)-methyltransferase [Agromyces sp. NDB4Y10]KZE94859.1 Modification methylase DpnIIA [Agromyces sp. NDB4Y10]